MHRLLTSFLLIALASILSACETRPVAETSVDRVLIAPTLENAPYRRIVVVGATPSRETDRLIEEGLMRELRERGLDAWSFVRSSAATKPSEETVRALVADKGADGVIVVSARFTGSDVIQRDQRVDVEARVKRGGLLDFFRYDYKEVTDPKYADLTIDVVYVSDFYDVATAERIYSVESSTAHGSTDYEIVLAESRAIADRLDEDGLIP